LESGLAIEKGSAMEIIAGRMIASLPDLRLEMKAQHV
jgi:hypothetical protein